MTSAGGNVAIHPARGSDELLAIEERLSPVYITDVGALIRLDEGARDELLDKAKAEDRKLKASEQRAFDHLLPEPRPRSVSQLPEPPCQP
jgi:hypothetical protein